MKQSCTNKAGDNVSAGYVLCDIQTDNTVISFEYEEEGTLVKILVQFNVKIFHWKPMLFLMNDV